MGSSQPNYSVIACLTTRWTAQREVESGLSSLSQRWVLSLKSVQCYPASFYFFLDLVSFVLKSCLLFFSFATNAFLLLCGYRDEVILHSISMYSSLSLLFGGISFAQICFSQQMIHNSHERSASN